MVVVKFQLGKDIRRVSFEKNGMDFETLSASVKSLYGDAIPTPFVFKYKDEDGDILTVAGDQELREALEVFKTSSAIRLTIACPAQDKKARFFGMLNSPAFASLHFDGLVANADAEQSADDCAPDANAADAAKPDAPKRRKLTVEELEQIRAARSALFAQRCANKEAREMKKAFKMEKKMEKFAEKFEMKAVKRAAKVALACDQVPNSGDTALDTDSAAIPIWKIKKMEMKMLGREAKIAGKLAAKAAKMDAKLAKKEAKEIKADDNINANAITEEVPVAEEAVAATPVDFDDQTRQLENMGFANKDANAKALAKASGDILSAVKVLLEHA